MKGFASVAVAALLLGSLAHAADAENSKKATKSTRHNPLTGNTVTTEKFNKKVKDGAGNEGTVNVTEETTKHRDGSESKEVKAKGTEEHK